MTTPLEHLSRNGRLGTFFIDGEWLVPRGTGQAAVTNPATEEVVTQFPLGNGEDVDAAVSAARRAFDTWSRTEPEYRAQPWQLLSLDFLRSGGVFYGGLLGAVIAVAMNPGATQLTRTSKRPSSIARVFVSPWMPAFAAE